MQTIVISSQILLLVVLLTSEQAHTYRFPHEELKTSKNVENPHEIPLHGNGGEKNDGWDSGSGTDCSELARQWEERFRILQEEMRRSQWTMSEQIHKQSQAIASLMTQAKTQEERFQKQSRHIKRLRDLLLQQVSRENEEEEEAHAKESLDDKEDDMVLDVTTTKKADNTTRQMGPRQRRADDSDAWVPVVNRISNDVERLDAEFQALNNWADATKQNSGTTYVRWGSKSCPGQAQLLYTGYVGGSWYDTPGAAVNYLCLPPVPAFDSHAVPPVVSSHNHVQELFGAEYQAATEAEHDMLPACSVCHSPKASTVMIPATSTCPQGWTPEYRGYLMAGATTHAAASEFVCVDAAEEFVAGTSGNENGKLLYYTVTHCGSLPCPPYVNGKVVLCVVCSK